MSIKRVCHPLPTKSDEYNVNSLSNLFVSMFAIGETTGNQKYSTAVCRRYATPCIVFLLSDFMKCSTRLNIVYCCTCSQTIIISLCRRSVHRSATFSPRLLRSATKILQIFTAVSTDIVVL